MPIVVADLVATLQVDQTRLQTGLAQAKAAFEAMSGSVSESSRSLQQITAFERAFDQETARLTALLTGQTKAVADLAAQYTAVKAEYQAQFLALKEQTAAELERRAAVEASRKVILNAGASEAATATALSKAWDELRGKQLEAAAAAETAAAAEVKTTASVSESIVLTQRATQGLRTFGSAATQAGRSLTLGLTTPLLALGAAAVKSSLDLAHANDTIRQQTGATGAALQGLEASFRRVATQVPQDFGEVAKAVALVAQRTHETGPALEALSKTELNLARVTGTDLATNIAKSSKLFQQFGIDVKDQLPALDLLFRAHQQTGAGFDRLQQSMLKFAPPLKALGLGFADAAALLGTLESHGANTERVVQGLNTALTKWAKAGVTDAHTALGALIVQVQKAPTAFKALQIATEAGFSARGGQDFVNAVRTSGFAFDELTKKILGGRDTINKAAQDTLHLGDQMKILQKNVELALQPLGDLIANQLGKLAQAASDATPKVRGLAEAFAVQSKPAKEVETALLGVAVAAGPALYGIGRLAQGWAGLTTTIAAGRGVVAGFFSAEVFAVALPIAAIGAVGLAIVALLTNFHGLGDDFISGWKIIGNTIQSVALAIPHFFENAWDSLRQGLSGLGERLRTDWATFGRESARGYQDAFDSEGRKRAAAAATQASAANVAVGSSGIGELRLQEAQAGPHLALPARPPSPAFRAGGGFPGGGTVPQVGRTALTPEQRKEAELLTEINNKQVEYNVLKAGENNILGQVTARYGSVNLAEEKHLAILLEKIKSLEKANTGLERYHQALAAVNAKIKEVEAGGKPAQAEKDFGPKVSPAMQATLQAQKQRLATDEQEARTRTELSNKITAALHAEQARHLELTGTKTKEATATVLLATAENQLSAARGIGDAAAIKQAEQNVAAAQHVLHLATADDVLAAALIRRQNAERDEQAVLDKVTAGLAALDAKHQEVIGSTVEEVNAQKVYLETLKLGTGIVAAFYQDQALFAIAQSENDKQTIEDKKALAKVTEHLTTLQQRAQEVIDSYGAKVTFTIQAETELAKAMLTHDAAAIKLAQDTLVVAQAADAAIAAHKEEIKQQTELQKALTKTRDFVENQFVKAFDNLRKGGLKHIFQSLLTDLDDFLFAWAAKIVAAKLTQSLFGNAGLPDLGGAGGAGGGASGTEKLAGGLVGLLGGLFGGGGPSAGDLATNLTGPMGLQGGGVVMGGQPSFVGERGPELFVPSQTGQIYSTHAPQTQAAMRRGTGGVTLVQNITVRDAQSFQKSQAQIGQDMSRLLERHRLRQGY